MQFTSWVNATTPAQLVSVLVTRSAGDDNNTLLVQGDEEDVDEDDPGDVRGAAVHDEDAARAERGTEGSRVNDDSDSLYNDLHDEIIDALVTFDGDAAAAVVTVAAAAAAAALDALLFTLKLLYAREREKGRQEERKKTRVSMVCSLEREDNK